MKSKEKINEKIKSLEEDLKKMQKEYDNLSQIPVQGPQGSYLKAQINKTKGKIESLRWVLDKR